MEGGAAEAGGEAVERSRPRRPAPPARRRRRRLGRGTYPEQQGEHPPPRCAARRPECQPPCRGEIQRRRTTGDLGDDRRRTTTGEPLLEGPQRLRRVRRRHLGEPPRIEPQRRETRPVEPPRLAPRLVGDDPQHPSRSSGEMTREERHRKTGDAPRRTALVADDLVQRPERQPAAGEPSVDRLDAEGKHRLTLARRSCEPTRRPPFESRDLPLEPRQPLRRFGRPHHGRPLFVHSMFCICSFRRTSRKSQRSRWSTRAIARERSPWMECPSEGMWRHDRKNARPPRHTRRRYRRAPGRAPLVHRRKPPRPPRRVFDSFRRTCNIVS